MAERSPKFGAFYLSFTAEEASEAMELLKFWFRDFKTELWGKNDPLEIRSQCSSYLVTANNK